MSDTTDSGRDCVQKQAFFVASATALFQVNLKRWEKIKRRIGSEYYDAIITLYYQPPSVRATRRIYARLEPWGA